MKRIFLATLVVVATTVCTLSYTAVAQIRTPAPSPLSTVTQQVGLTDIKITYSRPGMKGRTIFGDLVPYGKSWRTGANASTKISFGDEVTVGGKTVPAGEYALFTIPGENEWTVILHKNKQLMGTGGANYKQEEEVARFTVEPVKLNDPVETFTISFSNLTLNAADVVIKWDKTAIPFEVETDVDSKVMADIENNLKNIEQSTAGMYHQAASYYFETGRDLDQALEWVNKAVEGNPNAFWMSHLKAKILAKQNKAKEAIAAAEVSKKAAQAANNADYVKLNNDLIASIKAKK